MFVASFSESIEDKQVYLRGEFNSWKEENQVKLIPIGGGLFAGSVKLLDGKNTFKFVAIDKSGESRYLCSNSFPKEFTGSNENNFYNY